MYAKADIDGRPSRVRRHQAQFSGQLLVDRDGVVRWADIECAREALEGPDKFPTDEEPLAEALEL